MKIIQAVLVGVLLAVTATGALAAESNTDPAAESGGWLDGPWRFGALIYGWLPHAPADITYRQQEVAHLSESLDTILDSLQFTAMLEFEAHKGRLGFFVSPIYYKGKDDQHFTGELGQNRKLTVKEKVWLVDYGVGWDFGPWKLGEKAGAPMLTLTPIGGARYFHDPIEMEISPGILDKGLDEKVTVHFNTPFVGAKATVKFSDRWSFAIEGDYGVFDASIVNKTYQFMGAVNYHFTIKDVASRVIVAYRYLHIDLENNEIGLEVDVKGPLVGFGVEF